MTQDQNLETQQPNPSTNYWLLAVLFVLLGIIGAFFFHISQNKKQPSSILEEINNSRAQALAAADTLSDSNTVAAPAEENATKKDDKKKEKKTDKSKENKNDDAAASASEDYSYKVKSGDTLFKIAARFNQSPSKIKELNNMSGDDVKLDQTLTIPIRATHTVVSGDGLLAIALKYNVK
jgi:LysM repeat protein